MSLILYILLAFAVFFTMEGITWLTHRFVMHGFLWYLHEDHHQPRGRFFEKNDAFFLIFAIPSWLCIMLGLMYQLYWVVHDIIIHQRFKIFSRWNNTYVRAIRWAHKMHHKHLDKEDGESFGMLFVHKKYWEKVRKEKQLNPNIK